MKRAPFPMFNFAKTFDYGMNTQMHSVYSAPKDSAKITKKVLKLKRPGAASFRYLILCKKPFEFRNMKLEIIQP